MSAPSSAVPLARVFRHVRYAVASAREGLVGKSARVLAELACLALAMVIAGALLGQFVPLLDGINNFAPGWTGAALATLVVAWFGGSRGGLKRASVVALVAVLLFFAPVLRIAGTTQAGQQAQPVKVMTFNVHWSGRSVPELVSLVRVEEPDVILLQEVGRRSADALNASLRDRYPHRRFCNDWIGCDSALLSRWPITESRHILRGDATPPAIDAAVEIHGKRVRIVGVHVMNPEGPRRQQREMAWLAQHLASSRGAPMIVAGDFNLTPWSFTLARFAGTVGLVRHTGLSGSWPGTSRWLPPLFPIDHVLTSQHFASVRVTTGPRLGSDHLPVIATLSMR